MFCHFKHWKMRTGPIMTNHLGTNVKDFDGFYLAFPDLPHRQPWPDKPLQWPRRHPWSRWYIGVDIPSARYWRPEYGWSDGYELPVLVGETIELVSITTSAKEYLGIPYFVSAHTILRRVRLEAQDTYTTLYESKDYHRLLKDKSLDVGAFLLARFEQVPNKDA